LRFDAPVFDNVDEIRWSGPQPEFEAQCKAMGSPDLFARAASAAASGRAQTA
jgi:hypothetical protein